MSFETNPHIFRIGIRSRGGELLSPSDFDFEKMVGSGGGFRGDLPGLALLYRLRHQPEVLRLLTLLTGDLANRVQFYWRSLIYQRSPAGITRSGWKSKGESRLPVNWRGDYARAVRVRRNRYGSTVYVDSTVSRFLLALEQGSKAISERFFAGGSHNALDTRDYYDTDLRQEVVGQGDLRTSKLSRQERQKIIANRVRRLKGGEMGPGSQRILEWARARFGAGELIQTRRVTRGTGNRATSRRGVLVHTGIQKRETPNSINKNAYRLLIYIRTRGTKPVAIFSRLRDSIKQGGELQQEMDHVSRRWLRAVIEGGEPQ